MRIRRITVRYPSAFTLVELLVVVAIIALLLAILTPAIHQARLTAQSAVCMTNQRSHINAVHQFNEDYANYMPASSYARPRENSQSWYFDGPFWEFSPGETDLRTVNGESWTENRNVSTFWPYYKPLAQSNIWKCPAHPRIDEADTGDFGQWGANRTYYIINAEAASNWKPIEPYMQRKKLKKSAILNPALLFAFTDRRDYLDDVDLKRATTSFSKYNPTLGANSGTSVDDIGLHHFDGFNVAFVDGHVEYVKMGFRDPYIASNTQRPLIRQNIENIE